MAVFIALLRAVNVGGSGKLDMKALRAACEAVGFGRVSTYIQSGNLVLESAGSAQAAQARLEAVLRDRFGLAGVCVVRTARALRGVIEANPFLDAAAERPHLLHCCFLAGRPAAGARAALAAYEGPERVHLDGTTLYVDYAAGSGRSRLTPAYLAKTLGTASTARNWNTVNRVLEMALALEP